MDAEKLQRLVTTEMPYGKHKGTLLADLPANYLGWFAREGFPKGELGQLLALVCFLAETVMATRLLNFHMLQKEIGANPADTPLIVREPK